MVSPCIFLMRLKVAPQLDLKPFISSHIGGHRKKEVSHSSRRPYGLCTVANAVEDRGECLPYQSTKHQRSSLGAFSRGLKSHVLMTLAGGLGVTTERATWPNQNPHPHSRRLFSVQQTWNS